MAVSLQTSRDTATDFATLQFIFQQLAAGLATATLAQVVRCSNSGGLSAVGNVDVRFLVPQVTGDGTVIPHGVASGLPYQRVQGGANAVIIDPEPGDIGIVVFASRDISAVKNTRGEAAPGSRRQFSPSDGMYIGGVLNGVPTQYVLFAAGGIEVVSPTKVTLRAPEIELDGQVTGTAGADFADDVTADGTSVHTHTHGGVQSGGSETDPPS